MSGLEGEGGEKGIHKIPANHRPRGDGVFKVRETTSGSGIVENLVQVRIDTSGEYRRFTQVASDGSVEKIVFERV